MNVLFLLLAIASAPGEPPPLLRWSAFFASVATSGVTYSDDLVALEGRRVRLRGYAVGHPSVDGGLFLTHFEHEDPHGVEEHDLPWDAVVVFWREGLEIPPLPRRPTIEGVLRLGNRQVEGTSVTITIEDAAPVVRTPGKRLRSGNR